MNAPRHLGVSAVDFVPTPAGVVDLERARANARRVSAYTRERGLRWRPHVKTHKSLHMARLQLEAGAAGLTVATPHEAEVMAEVCDDLLLAYPPVGRDRIERIVALAGRVRLSVVLDSLEALEPFAFAAAEARREIGVLVEIDTGARRVGVGSVDEAIRIARRIREVPGVAYRGIAFYPGDIRVPVDEQDGPLRKLGSMIEEIVSGLRRARLAPEVVSGGSTPTLWRSHELPHLTEIRPGTAIFNDRDIASLGAASWDECAYGVLATVVSIAVPGQAVIDAGSKALSKEEFRAQGGGYGIVRDRPEVVVSRLSEEHGILDLGATEWRPRVGDRVLILPNHVCVSVNLQDRLWFLEDGLLTPRTIEARGR